MAGTITSFAFKAVERVSAPEPRHPWTVGATVIFGLDQLDPAPASDADFITRWQAAMSFQLGAEEFEKYCMARQRPLR